MAEAMNVMNLKKNLKKILSDRDMTAAQLSRLSGVPKTTLSEWLNGGTPRDLRKVKILADSLETSIDWLCFGEGGSSDKKASIREYADEINAGVFEVVLRKVHK